MRKSPLFVLFITIFFDLLGFGIIIPILPIFTKELGAADWQVGLIAAIYPIMNFLFAPFWGTLSDRHGRRPIILISVFITAFAYVVFSQANVLWILFLSRLLSGIGSANISVAQAYIADVTNPAERAKSMGLLGAAFGLGFVFGPTLGGYLKSISAPGQVDMVGFVAAGLCVANLVAAYFFLPESLKEKKADARFNFRVVTGIIKELRKPTIRELMWINFIFIVAFMLMQMASSLMWKEVNGMNEAQIGYLMGYVGVATAVVQGLLVGRIVKRWGESRLLLIGSLFTMAGLALLPVGDVAWFLGFQLLGLLCLALANGCITPSISSLLSKYANPDQVGHTLGVNQSFGSLARAAGMAMSGFLYGINFRFPFFSGVALMGIALAVSLVFRKASH